MPPETTTTAQAKGDTGTSPMCRRLIALALAVMLVCPPAWGAKRFDEAAVKAVFIFRLALFVTWPDPLTPTGDVPFVIGTIGQDPFSGRLEAVVQGERIGAQAISVRHYASPQSLAEAPCQLLYVGEIDASVQAAVRELALEHKILTISDLPRFAQEGGMIAIDTVAKRIQITINLAATRRAGFSISAKLLKIAQLIHDEAPRTDGHP